MVPLSTKKQIWKRILRSKVLYLMMVPGIILLIINNYIPMFGMIIAFKDFNVIDGVLGSPWAGFENFRYLFLTNDAWIMTRNTLGFNFIFIILDTLFGIGLAIVLNELRNRTGAKLYQTILLLPFFLSYPIVSYLFFSLLSGDRGFINTVIIEPLGFDAILFYLEPQHWLYLLPMINAWKGVGYTAIIYLAAIVGMDKEYYEASHIDGATKWKQTLYITIPMLLPVIIILNLLSIGRIFYADFGLFYQVTLNSGALFEVSQVIDTYVYRGLMQTGNIGMSAAAGFYQSVVGFVLVLASNMIVRKINKDYALF